MRQSSASCIRIVPTRPRPSSGRDSRLLSARGEPSRPECYPTPLTDCRPILALGSTGAGKKVQQALWICHKPSMGDTPRATLLATLKQYDRERESIELMPADFMEIARAGVAASVRGWNVPRALSGT